jgi:hypothetical protein
MIECCGDIPKLAYNIKSSFAIILALNILVFPLTRLKLTDKESCNKDITMKSIATFIFNYKHII